MRWPTVKLSQVSPSRIRARRRSGSTTTPARSGAAGSGRRGLAGASPARSRRGAPRDRGPGRRRLAVRASSSTRPRPPPGRCDDAASAGRTSRWWRLRRALLVVVLCIVVIAPRPSRSAPCICGSGRGAREIDDEGPALGEPLPTVAAAAADGMGSPSGVPDDRVSCSSPSRDLRRVPRGLPGIPAPPPPDASIRWSCTTRDAEQVLGVPGTPFVVVLDERGVVRRRAR